MPKSWWQVSTDLAMAGMEAQTVIALRTIKLAGGGPAASKEAARMVSEKMIASMEAMSILAGGGSMPAVLRRYRSIMKANTRRLSRPKR